MAGALQKPVPVRELYCECGAVYRPRRGRYGAGCTRCLFLDGHGDREAEIVGVLREIGIASLAEICANMGLVAPRTVKQGPGWNVEAPGLSKVAHRLRQLVNRGRVKKIIRDRDDGPPLYQLVSE